MMIVLPRKACGNYIMVTCLGYLSYCHIYRMYYHYGEYGSDDITLFLMLHVTRLSGLGYSYQDGATAEAKLLSRQKLNRVKSLPSLLELAGYTFFV